MNKKTTKTWITKIKSGEMLKSSGPIALEIKDLNKFGQVEIVFVMAVDVFMEKAKPENFRKD